MMRPTASHADSPYSGNNAGIFSCSPGATIKFCPEYTMHTPYDSFDIHSLFPTKVTFTGCDTILLSFKVFTISSWTFVRRIRTSLTSVIGSETGCRLVRGFSVLPLWRLGVCGRGSISGNCDVPGIEHNGVQLLPESFARDSLPYTPPSVDSLLKWHE